VDQANEVKQHILELENQRVQAFLQADTETLTRIFSDDLTFTHTGSNVDSKQMFIEKVATGILQYESLTTEGVQVRVYGSAAIVTGRADMVVTARGNQRRYSYAYTNVYVHQNNRWQMVAWQATRVPEG
jgi:uncharacterized protein (TIGR02246 family)